MLPLYVLSSTKWSCLHFGHTTTIENTNLSKKNKRSHQHPKITPFKGELFQTICFWMLSLQGVQCASWANKDWSQNVTKLIMIHYVIYWKKKIWNKKQNHLSGEIPISELNLKKIVEFTGMYGIMAINKPWIRPYFPHPIFTLLTLVYPEVILAHVTILAVETCQCPFRKNGWSKNTENWISDFSRNVGF